VIRWVELFFAKQIAFGNVIVCIKYNNILYKFRVLTNRVNFYFFVKVRNSFELSNVSDENKYVYEILTTKLFAPFHENSHL